MAGPRLADTGHGIVRWRRARLWGQGDILAAVRPGRNGPEQDGNYRGRLERAALGALQGCPMEADVPLLVRIEGTRSIVSNMFFRALGKQGPQKQKGLS